MSEVLDALILVVVTSGTLAATGVAVRAGLREDVPVLLDFLLAAGLLRLSTDLRWADIGSVGLVVAIRHLVTFGLRAHHPSSGRNPVQLPRGVDGKRL